jgi:hypothetical protein
VKTFGKEMAAEEREKFERVKQAWSYLGEIPWPAAENAQTVSSKKTVQGGESTALADLDGPGILRAIRIKADSSDDRMFRKALLEVYVDDARQPSVWSPLGDFFLDGFGQGSSQSLLLGKKDGTYYCYFPMPFERNIRIRVTNDSKSNLKLDAEVAWEPMGAFPEGIGRFYAWWHRQNPTSKGELFPILDAQGRGHWCGVSHAMQGGGGLGFLEGDEMLWIDDRDNAKYNGTGTEDYFNGGWYFGGTGNAPLYGCGVLDDPGSRALAFRLHLTDYVPFQQKARIGIEHGHANEVQADYAGVTYWYAETQTKHTFAPVDLAGRIPQSPRVPGALEAEDIVIPGPGVKIVSDAELSFTLSGGKAVTSESYGTPPSISLKVEAPESGFYILYGQLVASVRGGSVQILVDGKTAGEPVGTRSKERQIISMGKLADLPWLKKGPHELTFKMLKEGDRNYELTVDGVRLREKNSLEGEEAKVLASSGEPLGEQRMSVFGTAWSNDSHVWFRPEKPGAYFTLELPVEETKSYSLYAYLTKAGDYGIVQVKLDGKPLGQPFDGYNQGVVRSDRIDLGLVELTAGAHELTFEVTGKNPKSAGYMVGLDAILLR